MKVHNVAMRKSVYASLAGLTVGGLIVAAILIGSPDNKINTPVETEVVEQIPETTIAPSERETDNPFVQTMRFVRENNIESSAMLEIKIEPDGQYSLKECISGDILSKGMWSYDANTMLITLTDVGAYPLSNIFKVDVYNQKESDREIDKENIRLDNSDTDYNISMLSSPERIIDPSILEVKYQLTFIAENSTNLKYDLLANGDVFIQQTNFNPEQIQLNNIDGKTGDI